MSLHSDYIDYDVFLSQDFDPLSFANSLILSTNSPTDVDVDITTPSKRLGYDITEVQDRISNLAATKHNSLLSEANNVAALSNALEPLKPSVDSLATSYSKLQRDIMEPFYRAQNIHSALRRLHTTTGLLRSLSWFLYLLRQLVSIMDPIAGSNVSISQLEAPRSMRQANIYAISDARTLFKAGQTLAALKKLLVIEPALRSVQIIRTYESSLLPRYENRLVLHCQNILRFYSPTSSSVSMSENSSGSSNKAANMASQDHDDHDTLATYAASSLYVLKPDILSTALSRFVQSQSQAAVTEITRALPSLNLSLSAFTTALSMATDRAKFVSRYETSLKLLIPEETLQQAVREARSSWSASPSGVGVDSTSTASSKSNSDSLVSEYWRELGGATELRLKEFASSNSGITRTIRLKRYPPVTELIQQYTIAPFTKGQENGNSKVLKIIGDGSLESQSAKPDDLTIRQLSRALSIVFN